MSEGQWREAGADPGPPQRRVRATATPGIPWEEARAARPIDVWLRVEVNGVDSPLTAIPAHEQATFPFQLTFGSLLKMLLLRPFGRGWIDITVAVLSVEQGPPPEEES